MVLPLKELNLPLPAIEDVDAELARRRLLRYTTWAFPGYRTSKHHQAIVEKLEAVERGQIKRLMIFCPPRHGKSELVSVRFPAWFLGRNPDKQIIAASCTGELAEGFGRKVRNQIADPIFKKPFPGCALSSDSAASDRFSTTAGGQYAAVGVGGTITGRGAHLLIIDDPVKNSEEANSQTCRAKIKDWYNEVAYTRMMPGGAIIVMHTRWHEDDLAGWLMSEHPEEQWDILCLPAIAEEDDPLGREEGAALWQESYPIEALNGIRRQIGERSFSALYQQRPIPAGGSLIQMDWFKRYQQKPNGYIRTLHSWDTAFKPEQINDWSVCEFWGETESGWYLLDTYRARLAYPDLKRTAINLAARDNPGVILVEDKGSGQSLIQDLRVETRLPVHGVKVNAGQGKVFRLQAVSGLIESGRVYLPARASWLPDFEQECMTFPAGKHDDQVDSMSQALDYFRTSRYYQNVDNTLATKIPIAGSM